MDELKAELKITIDTRPFDVSGVLTWVWAPCR